MAKGKTNEASKWLSKQNHIYWLATRPANPLSFYARLVYSYHIWYIVKSKGNKICTSISRIAKALCIKRQTVRNAQRELLDNGLLLVNLKTGHYAPQPPPANWYMPRASAVPIWTMRLAYWRVLLANKHKWDKLLAIHEEGKPKWKVSYSVIYGLFISRWFTSRKYSNEYISVITGLDEHTIASIIKAMVSMGVISVSRVERGFRLDEVYYGHD
jgi:DNA-binding MarR family transcriptional regulator